MRTLNLIFVAAFFAACMPFQAVASDTYVVRNPEGRRPAVESSSDRDPVLRIGAGEDAVVYYGDGTMLRVSGPFNDRASSAARRELSREDLASRVTSMFVSAHQRRVAGAVRAGEPQAERPLPSGLGILDVSLDTDQKQCYFDVPIRLWRTNADQASDIILSSVGGQASKIDVKAGAAFTSWPSNVGISSKGGEYVVSYLDGQSVTRKFHLERLKLVEPSDLSVAALLDQGCEYQAAIAARLIDGQAEK